MAVEEQPLVGVSAVEPVEADGTRGGEQGMPFWAWRGSRRSGRRPGRWRRHVVAVPLFRGPYWRLAGDRGEAAVAGQLGTGGKAGAVSA